VWKVAVLLISALSISQNVNRLFKINQHRTLDFDISKMDQIALSSTPTLSNKIIPTEIFPGGTGKEKTRRTHLYLVFFSGIFQQIFLAKILNFVVQNSLYCSDGFLT